MNSKHLFLVVLALAISFSTTKVGAQSLTTGSISGVVTDPSNALIRDAQVTLKDNSKGTKQETKTNSSGLYEFVLLAPSSYTVTVSAAGFQVVNRTANVVLGQATILNIQMTVGAADMTITVTEVAPLIQTDNGNLVSTINETQVSQIPNPGNDLTYPVETTPGAVMNTSSGYGNFSAFGMPATSNLFTLNGMDDNDPFFNLNIAGSTGLMLGINEVQEVSVVGNGYSGQYGGLAGSNINYITRSGGNAYHGRAIYFWNGRTMNANSWFNNASGTPRSFVNANQWGADIGGPVLKNKLFWYFNTEGLRLVIPTSALAVLPSPQFQTATIANIDSIFGPTSASDAFYKEMFSLYSGAPGASRAVNGSPGDPFGCGAFSAAGFGPTGGPGGTAGLPCAVNFRSTISNKSHDYLVAGRVDYNIGNNDRIFGRVQSDHGLYAAATDVINPLFNSQSPGSGYQGQLLETHVFGGGGVNQLILSAQWYGAVFTAPNLSAALAAFPTSVSFGNSDVSFSSLALNDVGEPNGLNVTQFQASDDFSKTIRSHTIKFGGKFRRNDATDFDYLLVSTRIGVIVPLSLAAFYNGGVDPATGTPTLLDQAFSAHTEHAIATYTVGGYIEDEWRITPNFSTTLALRLDHPSNPVCQDRCFAHAVAPFPSLDHTATIPYNRTIVEGGKQALTGLTNLEVQPRLSFAWQPQMFGLHNTVIRGGIGIFFDQFPAVVVDLFASNPPLLNHFLVGFMPDNLAPGQTCGGSPCNLFADAAGANSAFVSSFNSGAPPNTSGAVPKLFTSEKFTHAPQYQKWSLAVEQGFGQNTSLSISYVGNHGIHETVGNNSVNAFAPGGFGDLPVTAPDLRFGHSTQGQNIAVSNYHGMIISFTRRFASGLIQANYAWSHALDEVSNGGVNGFVVPFFGGPINPSFLNPEDPENLHKFNYGSADYDVRHSFKLNYVWELPLRRLRFGHGPVALLKGWQVSGTLLDRSGLPFTPYDAGTTGTLAGTNYGGTVFANYAGGGSGKNCFSTFGVGQPNINNCLDPAKFSTSPTGFGNIRRNSFRGPGYFSSDFTIMKNTKIPGLEPAQFGIGAQFFNVFNHPNFDTPVGNVSSSLFGQITRTVYGSTTILGSGLGADASPRLIQLKVQLTF